jgi:hypothetical protein
LLNAPAKATSAGHAVIEIVQNEKGNAGPLHGKGSGTLRNIGRSNAIWMITLCRPSGITGWAVWTFVLKGKIGQDWVVFHITVRSGLMAVDRIYNSTYMTETINRRLSS